MDIKQTEDGLSDSNNGLKGMEDLSKSALENGIDEMSLDEINSEISLCRKERKFTLINRIVKR